MTVVRQRIECPVPRKGKGSSTGRDKGLNKFFSQILEAMIKHVDFDVVKVQYSL
jgi:protein pelota